MSDLMPDHDPYDDEPQGLGCVHCDMGWLHGCCDDMCYGCNEPQDCPDAYPCRHCNPDGDMLL